MSTTAFTIELPEAVAERVRARVALEGTTIEAKTAELLAQYGEPPLSDDANFSRQMAVAREELNRFRRTFQELAK
jgi:hypothetical protein